jgi:hypothetical protein
MKKYPLGTYWTGVAFLIFLLAPVIPNSVLKLVSGNLVGNFFMVGAVLLASKVSIGALLATFMAVAIVYVEYRKRIISKVMLVTPSTAVDEGKAAESPETINNKVPPKTQNGTVAEETHFYKARGLA